MEHKWYEDISNAIYYTPKCFGNYKYILNELDNQQKKEYNKILNNIKREEQKRLIKLELIKKHH